MGPTNGCRLWLVFSIGNALVGCIISTAFWLLQPAFALPQSVHVRLFVSHKPVQKALLCGPMQVTTTQTRTLPPGNYEISANDDRIMVKGTGVEGVHLQPLVGRTLTVKGLGEQGLAVHYGELLRHYPGSVSIYVRQAEQKNNSTDGGKARSQLPHTLMFVNNVSRSEYVAGVCAAEMPINAPLEALKSQAVLVETELAAYDKYRTLDDTTQNQAYLGEPVGRPEIWQAVRSVAGQHLCFQGTVAKTFYHSTCAGMTSSAANVFHLSRHSYPYMPAIKCQFCQDSPFYKTTERRIAKVEFAAVFGQRLPKTEALDASGRPMQVSYTVRNHNEITSGYQFWIKLGQSFGWDKAPSNLFALADGGAFIRIESRGAGHGVGMCQWGAIGLAKRGKNYREILAYYFPGTTLHP
jgi:SpoIID/LytB domain protein